MKTILCFILGHKDGKHDVVSIAWKKGFPFEYYFKCSRCGAERAIDNMQPFR